MLKKVLCLAFAVSFMVAIAGTSFAATAGSVAANRPTNGFVPCPPPPPPPPAK